MNIEKHTDDYKAPALEVRKRLLGSKRRSNHPEIKAARARLHAINVTAQKHGWHNVNPAEIKAACAEFDAAMTNADLQLRSTKGLR